MPSVLDQKVITYGELQQAISEANGGTVVYEVYRFRNQEQVGSSTFASVADAEQFIRDNDYDPLRVSYRAVEGQGADFADLDQLTGLDNAAAGTFRSWGNPDARLVREDGFTSRYLKKEYRERGLKTGITPYKFIDWEAAVTFLKARYRAAEYGGNRYWLRTMEPVSDVSFR